MFYFQIQSQDKDWMIVDHLLMRLAYVLLTSILIFILIIKKLLQNLQIMYPLKNIENVVYFPQYNDIYTHTTSNIGWDISYPWNMKIFHLILIMWQHLAVNA